MAFSTDPVDLAVGAGIAIAMPFIVWYAIRDLLSGFLPPARAKVPKPGELVKLLSPHLNYFVAALPRPAGDPLEKICEPIAPGSLPYFEGHGYVNAVLPLWKCGPKHSLAARSSSRGRKERTDFVWSGSEPTDKWDVRAHSEQGFLADTMLDLMHTLDWSDQFDALRQLRRAAEALDFKHLDATVAFYETLKRNDWSQLQNEDDDEDNTAQERSDSARFDFVSDIDEQYGAGR
jgi:hypothetical protein